MAISKDVRPDDKVVTRSFLNQLIDVLSEDISSSISRRKYQVFVTGGVGPGVTSSLFQTVYDQDFTLQTANPVFDITFGLAAPDSINSSGNQNTAGSAAKIKIAQASNGGNFIYPSSSMMMREKTDVYGQFAQTLLGNRKSMFTRVNNTSNPSSTTVDIDAALFIAFKRLFSRDEIKRETFALRFFTSASFVSTNTDAATGNPNIDCPPANESYGVTNLYVNSVSGSAIFTDIGSSGQRLTEVGGQFGYLVNASNPTRTIGSIFYNHGIVVLDAAEITSGSQFVSGTIAAMHPLGTMILGGAGTETAKKAKVIPDLVCSGSMDDVLDHFCYTRFGTGALTAMTFQNVTNINSSLIFVRALPGDFNYSSNPTYVQSTGDVGRLTIYDDTLPDETQEPFTYITTIGLYDSSGGLLAVAKLSRPVEKNPGRDLTFRVRLDF